jgi:hypothetical protein
MGGTARCSCEEVSARPDGVAVASAALLIGFWAEHVLILPAAVENHSLCLERRSRGLLDRRREYGADGLVEPVDS